VKLEIVTVGDELLLGFTIDTNAAYLARALAAEGVEVAQRATVGDDAGAIAAAVQAALERSGAVITTGGLGPTADDLTKPAIAALFGRGMHLDEPHAEWMRERWRRRFGREMPEANLQQATVPDGCRLLRNNHGSAPGIFLEDDRGRWVAMLPGVPREMRGMCDDTIVPMVRERAREAGEAPVVIASRTLRTTGIPESLLASRVSGIASQFADVSTAYLPGADGVDLRLTVRGLHAGEAARRLAMSEAGLREELAEAVYGVDADDLAHLVVGMLRDRSLTLAVAESCTGGLLGARVTAIPGSSDVFLGGVIAYADAVKVGMLGVDPAAIALEGAVSEPVARRMAHGARERTGAHIGVGITGVAGPGGGTEAKPVGTVWLAVDFGAHVESVRLALWGNREEIRHRATQSALDIIRRRLAAA
jgi:nicotinamide-nucleotide amidase